MDEQLTVFGRATGPEELRRSLASPQQIAGIRHLRFDGGPEQDMRLIEIRNASGLVLNLLPDRCLDLGQVWLNGFPFAWLGPNGLPPARAGGGGFDTALGGLLCTCGFDHIRQAVVVDGRSYPQHGSMALQKAVVETAEGFGLDGRRCFVVAARAVHGTLDGEYYQLDRRVSVPFDENWIRIEDSVLATSGGSIAPIMALYHLNLGYPLIADSVSVSVNGMPRDDLATMGAGTMIEPAPSGRYEVTVASTHGDWAPGIRITADAGALPWLQLHRRSQPGANLFCVEPTTHDRKPRSELLAGEVPGDGCRRQVFEIELSFSA